MWFLLALFTAFAEASRNALAKKRIAQFNPMIIAWAWFAFSLFLLIPILIYIGFPPLNNTYWIALVIVNVLNLMAFTLYMKALKLSPLSKSIPMLAVTPLYVLFTSFFINKELP
jgi:drug/metabolite transporter (DMT)-like permease